jgi:hypothetical protein
MMASHCLGP